MDAVQILLQEVQTAPILNTLFPLIISNSNIYNTKVRLFLVDYLFVKNYVIYIFFVPLTTEFTDISPETCLFYRL